MYWGCAFIWVPIQCWEDLSGDYAAPIILRLILVVCLFIPIVFLYGIILAIPISVLAH